MLIRFLLSADIDAYDSLSMGYAPTSLKSEELNISRALTYSGMYSGQPGILDEIVVVCTLAATVKHYEVFICRTVIFFRVYFFKIDAGGGCELDFIGVLFAHRHARGLYRCCDPLKEFAERFRIRILEQQYVVCDLSESEHVDVVAERNGDQVAV